jgi:hypothetical protein
LNAVYHYMLATFRAMYGKIVTVHLHYGNGPDRAPTSFHMCCEGLGQGDAPVTIYFNVLLARVYMKQLEVLRGRGVLQAMADDVKIMAPLEEIGEMAESFPALAWEEAGLTTQKIKNRIFVQPTARPNWCKYLESTPRKALTELPVHDIPYGSDRADPFNLNIERMWMEDDGVNILGNPLRSKQLVSSYLKGK